MKSKKQGNNNLKLHRKTHRIFAIIFLFFFLILSGTGILLGWKKHSAGVILPESKSGSSTNINEWLSFDSLSTIALSVWHDSVSENISATIARIDARPDKGMVKFVFENHLTEIQLDASTGSVLYVGKRWSDLIEHLHDGSFIDRWLGINNEYFKLTYITLMGLSLLTLSITGFFLWRRNGIKRSKP
ncbi:MAG: PepSY domain-containing protein [Bacteroidales bacterium]|nr:PepSY domain-containing protein [Bacteroidales bacterium]